MKRLIMLITFIITLFIFFLGVYLIPRNYEKSYELNEVKVNERYIKKSKVYYLTLEYNDQKFELVTSDKYTTKRGLINNISITEEKDHLCLDLESKYLNTYPLCTNYKDNIAYSLLKNAESDKISFSYKNNQVYNLNDKTFLLWNYKGFDYIKNKITKEINFLDSDNYNPILATKANDLLFVPDYSSSYTFNKAYVIDIKSGNVKTWDLDNELYFDGYILGTYKRTVFLYDFKQETEFELRLDKLKMRKVKLKRLVDNKWEGITTGDLNKKIKFENNDVFNYKIVNNKLYLYYFDSKIKTLISNEDVKSIIYKEADTVYYLAGSSLYMFNQEVGNMKLLTNFEWNFHFDNMIFIY